MGGFHIWNQFNQGARFLRSLRQQKFVRGFNLVIVCLICLGIGWGSSAPALAEDYNKEFLVGADFSGRVLTDSSFTKANLRNSNFSHADLRGVSFFGANLEAANLEGANLSSATLDTARFSTANLTNAVLEGAFAFNAKFDGAIIDGADFTDVEFRQDAQLLLCKVAKGKNPTTGRNTRDSLNCP
ncbi:pentapeptide repeat-containing protein [Kovacikia minuta CCNUW1]|uniref:pentapeptide repeat-containing protein n=1 Tax=Kovacikia minuta TaxID=2931930 RepID=UPI001CC9716A|nr:pentapeptide repeat-containing protein [Kovacikia minuta]UBF29064.1 pentapeptide repeat-containing protein [Kovacikia minuta CCNUW1]